MTLKHELNSIQNAFYTITHARMSGKPGGKRPLERPRRRWVDNIKTNLKEIGSIGVNLLHLVQRVPISGGLL